MVLSGQILQETVTHSKALTEQNLIKGLFTEMLAGFKGFIRDSEHQGTCKNGKSLPLSGL